MTGIWKVRGKNQEYTCVSGLNKIKTPGEAGFVFFLEVGLGWKEGDWQCSRGFTYQTAGEDIKETVTHQSGAQWKV